MTVSRPDRGHLAALDGLRGVAAVAVTIRHTLNAIPMPVEIRRALFESPLAIVLSSQGAVQLFFVLSGWVLAASLARERDPGAAILPFYVRRVFRIHPPYVFAVLVAWLASAAAARSSDGAVTPWIARFVDADPSARTIIASLAFPSTAADLLPVGWTLTVEMIYSFALPALAYAAGLGRGLPLLAAAVLMLATPSRVAWYGLDFVLGIVAYQQRAPIGRALARLPAAARAMVPLTGAVALAAPVAFFAKHERQGVLVNRNDAVEIAVMSAGAALLVIAAVALPRFGRAIGSRPFAFLGRISYSVYLLHHTLLSFAAPLLLTGAAPLREGVALVLLVALGSIALSIPSHRWIEAPSIAMGTALSKSLATRLAASAAPGVRS